MLTLDLLHGLQCSRYNGSVRDHREIRPRLHDLRLAERDHVIRAGIGNSSEGFAIEAFVLQEHHRIIATNRGPEQARSIECIRRKNDAQSRSVGENALATL